MTLMFDSSTNTEDTSKGLTCRRQFYDSNLRLPPPLCPSASTTSMQTNPSLKSVGCSTDGVDVHHIYQTEKLTNGQSEFMIVDLMDQLMFSVQQMGALLLDPTTESRCIEELLSKQTVLELVNKEILDRELQQKQYALEVDYYKTKIYSNEIGLRNREIDLENQKMLLKEKEIGILERELTIKTIEQQRQVVMIAKDHFTQEMVENCYISYEMLFPLVDFPEMFVEKAKSIWSCKDPEEVYEIVFQEDV